MTSEQQAELEQYRKAAREYHESVERRLAKLEAAEKAREAAKGYATLYSLGDPMTLRPGQIVMCKEAAEGDDIRFREPVATSSSRCVVTEAQVEYWERIREAARDVVDSWPDPFTEPTEIRSLRKAVYP